MTASREAFEAWADREYPEWRELNVALRACLSRCYLAGRRSAFEEAAHECWKRTADRAAADAIERLRDDDGGKK